MQQYRQIGKHIFVHKKQKKNYVINHVHTHIFHQTIHKTDLFHLVPHKTYFRLYPPSKMMNKIQIVSAKFTLYEMQ